MDESDKTDDTKIRKPLSRNESPLSEVQTAGLRAPNKDEATDLPRHYHGTKRPEVDNKRLGSHTMGTHSVGEHHLDHEDREDELKKSRRARHRITPTGFVHIAGTHKVKDRSHEDDHHHHDDHHDDHGDKPGHSPEHPHAEPFHPRTHAMI